MQSQEQGLYTNFGLEGEMEATKTMDLTGRARAGFIKKVYSILAGIFFIMKYRY
jgi:hypothetical protein